MVNCLNIGLSLQLAAFTSEFVALIPESRHSGQQTQQFSAKFETINSVLFCDANRTQTQSSTIQWNLNLKSPKSTTLNKQYFGLPLLNSAPTLMLRKLVSSKIFRHRLFRQYCQSAAFIWHKTTTYSTTRSILKYKPVTHEQLKISGEEHHQTARM